LFVEPPFNYTGSKFSLLPQIAPLFDKSKSRLVDLFAGGGSVYGNMAGKYEMVLANDIIADLIGCHKALLEDMAGTLSRVRSLAVRKDDDAGYARLRASYNEQPEPLKLWALMACCTNNMMRFNKSFKFNQTFGRRTFNDNTEAKARGFVARVSTFAKSIEFSAASFDAVKVGSGDMVYADPPYSNTEAGYNAYWGAGDDVRLFEYLLKASDDGASVAVSGVRSHAGEPCRLLDMLHGKGFGMLALAKDYNKVSRAGAKKSEEVLMTNYDPPAEPEWGLEAPDE
jgi:DNA adenine methylase Dam